MDIITHCTVHPQVIHIVQAILVAIQVVGVAQAAVAVAVIAAVDQVAEATDPEMNFSVTTGVSITEGDHLVIITYTWTLSACLSFVIFFHNSNHWGTSLFSFQSINHTLPIR